MADPGGLERSVDVREELAHQGLPDEDQLVELVEVSEEVALHVLVQAKGNDVEAEGEVGEVVQHEGAHAVEALEVAHRGNVLTHVDQQLDQLLAVALEELRALDVHFDDRARVLFPAGRVELQRLRQRAVEVLGVQDNQRLVEFPARAAGKRLALGKELPEAQFPEVARPAPAEER